MSAQFIPLPATTSRLPAAHGVIQGGLLGLGGYITRSWRAHDTRRQLAELDAHLLRDIGITALDAQFEASRKPWDLQGR